MFFRTKFDGAVGKVLSEAGYTSTAAKLAAWPTGLSATYVENAKRQGIDEPNIAAYFAVALFYSTDGVPHHSSVDKSAIADALVSVIMADDSIDGIRLVSDLMPKIAKMRQV